MAGVQDLNKIWLKKNHCYFAHEISYLLTTQASIAWEAFRQMFLLDVVEQVAPPLVLVITISASPKVSGQHSLAENHLVTAEFVLDNRAQDQKDLGLLDHCIFEDGVGSSKFVVLPICRIERGPNFWISKPGFKKYLYTGPNWTP